MPYACLAVLVAACSGSGTPIGSTADAESFCTTMSKIALAKGEQCFSAAPVTTALAEEQAASQCAAVKRAVDEGRSAYDPASGSACAHAVAALDGCAAYLAMANPSADCSAALRGTVATGGACSSASDCADGYCRYETWCGGHCVAAANEGEPCGVGCAPGLWCNWSSGNSPTCVAPSGDGGPCPCKAGFYCDFGTVDTVGTAPPTPTCKPQRASGYCEGYDECAPGHVCSGGSYVCGPGLSCGRSPSACIPLVGLGAKCGASASCGYGYYCDPLKSTCAAYPDLGQTCVLSADGTTADLGCVRGRCDRDGTKKCVPRKADGEPCTSYDECLGYCEPATSQCTGSTPPPAPVCTAP